MTMAIAPKHERLVLAGCEVYRIAPNSETAAFLSCYLTNHVGHDTFHEWLHESFFRDWLSTLYDTLDTSERTALEDYLESYINRGYKTSQAVQLLIEQLLGDHV